VTGIHAWLRGVLGSSKGEGKRGEWGRVGEGRGLGLLADGMCSE